MKEQLLSTRSVTSAGCWEGRSLTAGGYARVHVNGRTYYAHRLSWQLYRGAIPLGLSVLHRCDNRRCFNPRHLFVGTQADNITDAIKKGRHIKGERVGTSRLTAAHVAVIRKIRAWGVQLTERQLATLFGVCQQTINDIAVGRTWRHI